MTSEIDKNTTFSGAEREQAANQVVSVTVPAGANAVSDPIDIEGARALIIIAPAGWVSTTLGFQVSADGITYVRLADTTAGTDYATGSLAASRAMALPAVLSANPVATKWLKIISVTDQTTQRTLQVVLKS